MGSLGDLLFHTPWWLAILIAIVGLGFWRSGNKRQDQTLKRVGYGIVGAALLLGIVGYIFPSDRTRLENRTRQMVAAVDHQDWDAVAKTLDAQTAVGSESHTVAVGKDAIVLALRGAYDRYGVKTVSASSVESQQTGTLITVSFNAYHDTNVAGQGTSSWQVDYEKSGGTWVMEKITVTRVMGASPEVVFSGMP